MSSISSTVPFGMLPRQGFTAEIAASQLTSEHHERSSLSLTTWDRAQALSRETARAGRGSSLFRCLQAVVDARAARR